MGRKAGEEEAGGEGRWEGSRPVEEWTKPSSDPCLNPDGKGHEF